MWWSINLTSNVIHGFFILVCLLLFQLLIFDSFVVVVKCRLVYFILIWSELLLQIVFAIAILDGLVTNS